MWGTILVLPDPESYAVMTVPEHPLIYLLSEKTQLKGRNLPIPKDMYEASRKLPGSFEFTAEQANALRSNAYSERNARRAAWESWNNGNVELTNAYVADVEKSTRYKFNESIMGIWMPRSKGGRLLTVCRVDDCLRSNVYGDGSADDKDHLFGEAAELQDVTKKIEDARTWAAQFPGLEERL